MFYKLRNNILFRQYETFGYLTDCSDFTYRFLDDSRPRLEEAFVSQSGASFIAALSKTPTSVEDITDEISKEFNDVDKNIIKNDAIELFQQISNKGYIVYGETPELCIQAENKWPKIEKTQNEDTTKENIDHNQYQIDVTTLLRSVHIELTSACNERCIHCYIPHDCAKHTISLDRFSHILEECKQNNIVHITISGGEPLLHKHFIEFIAKCREQDLAVNVLTNLTLMNDEIFGEMRKNPLLSVQTSLYSTDPKVHDAITQRVGSWEKTTQALFRLCEAGIPVQISCPVIKLNQNDVYNVIKFGQNHNIEVVIEPSIFASYDNSQQNIIHRLNLEEIGNVIDQELQSGKAPNFLDKVKELQELTEKSPICSICRYSVCIAADCTVFPCAGWQKNILGDLNTSSLKDIWNNSQKVKELRSIKRNDFPACMQCENKDYCTICMMRNANEHNGDAFRINHLQCEVASLLHQKLESFKSH